MSTCEVCKKEIVENEKIKYGFKVHEQCSEKVIWYNNSSWKDSIMCCKEELWLKPTFLNGCLKGIGQCKCSKIYITDRFPSNPKPRKLSMPKKE